MTEGERLPSLIETESRIRERTAELIERNTQLLADLQQIQKQNADIAGRLRAAHLSSVADREMRLAALNLMEDAVDAQRRAATQASERRRVVDELEEANRRKDEFLATLAHELRAPLAPVSNALRVLRTGGLNPEQIDALHEMMDRQIAHMGRLVGDLMEVSRVTRGRIELRRERLDLAEIVRHAVETSAPLIEAGRLKLVVNLPEGPTPVDADPVRLAQVLSNLLHNACKYTEPDGEIAITVTKEKSNVQISVRDNGAGIPAEMLPKVFDLFAQGAHAYSRSKGGLGIGLTLVRRLVELHGGTVEGHSPGPGQGSEFVVSLPIDEIADANTKALDAAEPACELAHRRMLVVDDSIDSANTMALFLKMLGAEVCTVNDGAAALNAIPKFLPTAILLDIGMPGMDGYEVARRVRQLPGGDGLTLIALTGWGQEEDRRRSAAAGFNHHLVKPVELESLERLLKSPVTTAAANHN